MGNSVDNKKTSKEVADIKYPVSQLLFIIASFALALLDMTFLYQAIAKLIFHNNYGVSMAVAFFVATIANFTALYWGYSNGRNLARKSINRKSLGSFIAWVFIGCFYAGIRIANMVINNNELNVTSEILQAIILAISYVGTGSLISSAAAKIFNRDLSDARKFQKRFKNIHEDLTAESAEIQRLTETLKNYNQTYESLDEQKKIIKTEIFRAEKALMYAEGGKIIKNNPNISPALVYQIIEEFLEKRKKDDAKDI